MLCHRVLDGAAEADDMSLEGASAAVGMLFEFGPNSNLPNSARIRSERVVAPDGARIGRREFGSETLGTPVPHTNTRAPQGCEFRSASSSPHALLKNHSASIMSARLAYNPFNGRDFVKTTVIDQVGGASGGRRMVTVMGESLLERSNTTFWELLERSKHLFFMLVLHLFFGSSTSFSV